MNRRRFMLGTAAAAGAFSAVRRPRGRAVAAPSRTPVLSGSEFQLEIGPTPINITGQPRIATAVNGQVPAPILRWREGDTVTLAVSNRLSVPS
jgi:FtsP/CotA-like multicopper oxidase with cupredoxin domain